MAPVPRRPPSSRTPIRLSLRTLILTAASSLALPALASAQSSQGAIGVAATILPAPVALSAPRVTFSIDDRGSTLVRVGRASPSAARTFRSFVRVTGPGTEGRERAFIAQPLQSDSAAMLRLPASVPAGQLRLERLVVAGT
jgi:hypothetical protein